MHKVLNNVFMALSLTEATAELSLNSVNNTTEGWGNKAKLSLGRGKEEHPGCCAQAIASYVLCSKVLTGGLGRGNGQQFAPRQVPP